MVFVEMGVDAREHGINGADEGVRDSVKIAINSRLVASGSGEKIAELGGSAVEGAAEGGQCGFSMEELGACNVVSNKHVSGGACRKDK
jgi:hypothetical protein